MKIAFFSDNFYPELSGIADSLLLTGAEFARRGHEVHYFVPRYARRNYETASLSYGEPALEARMRVHRMMSLSYGNSTLQGRMAIPYLLRGIASRERFDIVHTHSFFGPGIDALLFSRLKRIPLIGTNHTLIEEFIASGPARAPWLGRRMRSYVIWYYNHCVRVSTPSGFLARHMQEGGLRSPVSVVSNPVAREFFAPRSSRESLKRQLGLLPFTILYAGRLSAEKGVVTLLRGFIAAAKRIPEAGLVLAGHGPLRAELEKEAGRSGVGTRVKFVGLLLGEKKKTLYDLFHASDVFATASTTETQCMSMMQAMAAGMPVVGARAAALPEYIRSERGFLFEPGDADELSRHLFSLYADSSLRARLGTNAALFARAFSVSEVATQWEDLYKEKERT